MPGLFKPSQRAEHEFGRANLSLYLDERLDARDKQRLERHLATCSTCEADLATLRQTVSLLRHAPARRAPRSFVLPASVQRQQAAYRRWGFANATLRVSALAVSFLLVLFVSSDVWLGSQALPMDSAPVPVAAKRVQPTPVAQQERAIAPAPQQPVTAATAAKSAAGQPVATRPNVATEALPQGEQKAAPVQPPLGLRDEGDAGGRGGGVVESPITAPARSAAGAATPAPTRTAVAAGTATHAVSESASRLAGRPTGVREEVGEPTTVLGAQASAFPATDGALSVTLAVSVTLPLTATASLANAGGEMAPTPQLATPTMAVTATLPPTPRPSPTPRPPTLAPPTQRVIQPTALPTQAQVAKATPQPTQTASQAIIAADRPPSVPANAWVWPLWRTARTLAGLSAGLLLILLAGILWSGQKRRV